MTAAEVIGYLNSYKDDVKNGTFNPVQYLGLDGISGFTYIRDKETGEVFLIDRHGEWKEYHDLNYGRNPNAVDNLTGDYEFWTGYRAYVVGCFIPKNPDISSINDALELKDTIIANNIGSSTDMGIGNIELRKFDKNMGRADDAFSFYINRIKRYTADFILISAERLHEINRCRNIIGQNDTIPYNVDAPDNAIYCIILSMNYTENRRERIEESWSFIRKILSDDFEVNRFAECDCQFYSN